MIMEGDPFLLIEGMMIAARATGATRGYIYTRSEYPHAIETMEAAIRLPGGRLSCIGFRFRHRSAGSAGAMYAAKRPHFLEAWKESAGRCAPNLLCGSQGSVRLSTVVNNVLSLAATPFILSEGAEAYATHAPAGRVARCRSSWPATSSMAACSRRRSE